MQCGQYRFFSELFKNAFYYTHPSAKYVINIFLFFRKLSTIQLIVQILRCLKIISSHREYILNIHFKNWCLKRSSRLPGMHYACKKKLLGHMSGWINAPWHVLSVHIWIVKRLRVIEVSDGHAESPWKCKYSDIEVSRQTGKHPLSEYSFTVQWDVGRCFKKKSKGSVCLIPQSCGEVASESGDRLQVTHVATEIAMAGGDESPISVLL